MKVDIKVEISSQLRKNLKATPNLIQAAVKKALINIALAKIETSAKNECRVDTGRLRGSLHIDYAGKGKHSYKDNHGGTFDGDLQYKPVETDTKVEVIVGTNVIYGKKIERMYPYLYPAFESAKQYIKPEISKQISKIRLK